MLKKISTKNFHILLSLANEREIFSFMVEIEKVVETTMLVLEKNYSRGIFFFTVRNIFFFRYIILRVFFAIEEKNLFREEQKCSEAENILAL